ncbi:MAG: hypothetical protein ACP5K1_05155 [Candidatus Bathyarchaeia archaeon]
MSLEVIQKLFGRISRRRLNLLQEALRVKRSLKIRDEFGLERPISITVIVPTFLRSQVELSGYRYEVIRNELVILGRILTHGLIDEIIIVDGSVDEKRRIDERLARQMASTAYRSIPLFHDQVNQLNKFSALKDRAKLGLYDFVFRIIHQRDPQIDSIARSLSILPDGIPAGKGAGLWLAVGVSSGDILVFMDSDIRSLEEWQVVALIEPILKSLANKRKDVEFVKAYYTRLSVNLDSPEKGFYKLGGRATRLFFIPFIKVLARHGILKGLEKLRYPLSGEFAGKRELITSLSLPANYDVEAGMLIDLWKRRLIDKIVEADLHLFQHFPQPDEVILKMVEGIVNLLTWELRDHLASISELDREYLQEAYREIKRTQTLFERIEIRSEVDQTVRRIFHRDVEGDKRRVEAYAEMLRRILLAGAPHAQILCKMPPWQEITGRIEGKNFQNFLQRRSVIYTLQLLSREGIVKI